MDGILEIEVLVQGSRSQSRRAEGTRTTRRGQGEVGLAVSISVCVSSLEIVEILTVFWYGNVAQ